MPTLESTVESPVSSTPAVEANGHAPKAAKTKATAKAGGKGKVVKKAAAKGKAKAAKAPKKEKGNKEAVDRGPSKGQIKILKILARNSDGLTRQEISERLGTKDKPVELKDRLGHATPEKVTPKSLLGRKLASIHTGEPRKLQDGSFSETEGPKVYKITAAGKKFIETA